MFELEFKQPFALIRIGFEDFLYKVNVKVLGEMLSKFSKTFVLAITHPNRVIQISRKKCISIRTNFLEISVFKFGPHWTLKFVKVKLYFRANFGFVLVQFWCFGI